MRLSAICVAAAALLAACTSPRPFELTEGQPPTYLDNLAPQEQANASSAVSRAAQLGTRDYTLQPGDVVDVLYSVNRTTTAPEFRIAPGDEVEITFDFHPDMNRSYVVRPDGRIALPRTGEMVVARKRPADVAREVAARYRDLFVDPSATVNMRKFTGEADTFMAIVAGPNAPHAEKLTVGPNGMVEPPMVDAVRVSGRTTAEVAVMINHEYAKRYHPISVGVRLNSVAAQQVFIFGEVQRPGPVQTTRGRTVLQLIASAGGPNEFAAMDAVRVLYWDEVGQARVRLVNVMAALEQARLDQELVVPANAVVYVPPTALAKAGRYVDQILRRLFLFQGTSIGIQYGQTLR